MAKRKQHEDRLKEAIGQGLRSKMKQALEMRIDRLIDVMNSNAGGPSADQFLTLAKALAYVQVHEEKELRELNRESDIEELSKEIAELSKEIAELRWQSDR